MAKAEWGTKRTCRDCGARFYDLKQDPAPCPQCGAEFAVKAAPRSAREAPPTKIVEEAAPDVKAETVAAVDDDDDAEEAGVDEVDKEAADDAIDGNNDEEDLIEDASDLGQDDDDMSEAREHIDKEVTDKP